MTTEKQQFSGPGIITTLVLIGLAFFAGFSWANQRQTNQPAEPRAVTARGQLTAREQSTVDLFEQASPSVVYITSSRVARDFFSRNVMEIPQGSGSGFVWDQAGHIVTNYHVVRGADRWQVTLADQSTWEAVPVGSADTKDLAVVKIDAPPERLHPIPIGSSSDLRVGQEVLAIGNPFGLDQTLTTGIISALGREIESLARIPIRDVIQTDAAINPGNSGGPLIDTSGRLIGVNTAIYSPSGASAGIGFSIPVDVVNWVVPELITSGRLRRPSMGVELGPAQWERRLGIEGAIVLRVYRGTGADRAGIQPIRQDRFGRVLLGDVIVAIDDTPIETHADVILALERRSVGEVVNVTILREGDRQTVQVQLGETQ